MAKVIVEISGGVCQGVYSDDPTLEVVLFDWDNITAEVDDIEDDEERSKIIEEYEEELSQYVQTMKEMSF